jgi:pimeloyl-ACP methyl ester carboxylesterase
MKFQLKSFLILFCLTTTAFSQSGKSVFGAGQFKQLAGDADEIAAMRLPAPETLAVSSKSAVIPVAVANAGNIEIPTERAENFRLMLIAPNSHDWKINVALPGESFTDLRTGVFSVGLNREESEYGLDGNQFPAQVFTFDSINTGVLRIKINLPNFPVDSTQPVGYLMVGSDSPYRLRSYVSTLETVVGRELGFIAELTDKSENAQIGNIREASVKLQIPGGKTLELSMGGNSHGTFSGSFVPSKAGKYIAQIVARGATPEGDEFIRTGEHVFNVAGSRALIGNNATVKMVGDVRLSISLPVIGVPLNQKVLAHAEVWAHDADGNETPVAWIGGMTLAGKGKRGNYVSLSLDSRWLARAVAKQNYELRNIRLQDSNSFAVLGTADTVTLPALTLPKSLQNFTGEITEEMRTGERPAIESLNALGGKLMLVHGYCSGSNPWNPAQFANSVQFLDANQNRSHDQFAQLIRNFGASFPSFGIVAHSQGGAAALHLYTYYWSGLDYATGSRLIQTVGTPYQGTALAGNLALLGSIFGAGCGPNTDLSYSGAAAWLANIPSWARAKVYYHTTSFTDVWWRYDYCNIASDVVLSDPDDGVTEKDKDQLSGANNMGHKTGWCHTSGMRDPAQTSDAARNATMNASAAR